MCRDKAIEILELQLNIRLIVYPGLESQFGALRERVSEMASIVSNGITVPLDINSPSKLFTKYGNYIVEGLANGIKSNLAKVKNAAIKMSEVLSNESHQNVGMVYSETESPKVQELKQEINTEQENIEQPLLNELIQQIKVIWDKITQPALPDLFQQIKTTINEIELPELPEMELMITPVIKSLPKLEDVSLSMANIASPSFATSEELGATNNYGSSTFNINITGSNAEEIWDKLERKLGRLGMVF